MGDLLEGCAADSNDEHDPVSEEPKSPSPLNGCCAEETALNSSMYAEELLKMRAAVERDGGSFTEADEAIGLQFLLDCPLKPAAAAKKFVQAQKWKALHVPLGYVPDSEVSSLLAMEIVAVAAGKAKNGRLVLLVFASKFESEYLDYDIKKCFTVYILEKITARQRAIDKMSGALPGGMAAIIDLNGVGVRNFDFDSVVLGVQLQQKYYPRMLSKIYMVNPPNFVVTTWKFLAPLLPKIIKDRIVVVERQDTTDVLLSIMDADVLPKSYGGRGEAVLIQNVQVPHWDESSGNAQ